MRMLLIAALVVTFLCGVARSFPINTTDGTHLFMMFDRDVQDPMKDTPKEYVFVFGSTQGKIYQPPLVRSQYFPYSRDPAKSPLQWWVDNHPSWILYQCDKVTPAYLYHDENVPLDLTNPDVFNWQVAYLNETVADQYPAVAADNLSLFNGGRGCGIWQGNTNGTKIWKQIYSGEYHDDFFTDVTINWLKTFKAAIWAKYKLLLTINFSLNGVAYNDPRVLLVGNYTDAIVNEAGFTNNGKEFLLGDEWTNITAFMHNVQRQAVAYFSGNEWNETLAQHQQVWLLASYIIGKESACALYTSRIQGYGNLIPDDWMLKQTTGTPLSPSPIIDASTGVYYRNTTELIAIVNPVAGSIVKLKLDWASYTYVDIADGSDIAEGQAISGGKALLVKQSRR